MKVTREKTEKLKITDVDGLDPVTVFLEDHAPGRGEVTIKCYGESWSAYWGGMGDRTVSEFINSCDADYISGKLSPISETEIDFDALDRVLGITDSEQMLRWNPRELEEKLGCSTHEYDYPMKPNPGYEYLRRIVETVQQAIKLQATDGITVDSSEAGQ